MVDAMKTSSEQLFERFCEENGVKYDRIVEEIERSADYLIEHSGQSVVCEVKEIEEQDDFHTPENPHGKVNNKAREKISKGAPQVKRLTQGKRPGMIVLYNLIPPIPYTSPDMIQEAMFGETLMVVSMEEPGPNKDVNVDFERGGKRKTTQNCNTSISCVAVLEQEIAWDNKISIRMDIYHNPFARVPLDIENFRFPNVRHFKIDHPEQNYYGWEEI